MDLRIRSAPLGGRAEEGLTNARQRPTDSRHPGHRPRSYTDLESRALKEAEAETVNPKTPHGRGLRPAALPILTILAIGCACTGDIERSA